MNHHHEHGVYYGDDNWDAECCICCANPCNEVTTADCVEHERQELQRTRDNYEQQISYILEHGKRELAPF